MRRGGRIGIIGQDHLHQQAKRLPDAASSAEDRDLAVRQPCCGGREAPGELSDLHNAVSVAANGGRTRIADLPHDEGVGDMKSMHRGSVGCCSRIYVRRALESKSISLAAATTEPPPVPLRPVTLAFSTSPPVNMGRKRVRADQHGQHGQFHMLDADMLHVALPGSPAHLASPTAQRPDRQRPDRPPRPRLRQTGAAGVPPGAPQQQRQPFRGRQHAPPPPQVANGPSVALHRGHFVGWSPTEVTSGAATADATAIAIARASGDIEIWDSLNWNCLKVPMSTLAHAHRCLDAASDSPAEYTVFEYKPGIM